MRKRTKYSSIAVVVAGAFAAIVVAGGRRPASRRVDPIVAEREHALKPRRRLRPPDPRTDHDSAGAGQTVISTNGQTPCPKRPGAPKFWEGAGEWNPCTGNLLMRMLGGLLVFNSERNSAIHPFHQTGGAPPGGYAGWGFKIGAWDQQLTPDDAGSPPASVTIADGEDGQDVYVLKPGSSNPFVYEDREDKHWTVTTRDQRTFYLETFEGVVLEYDTRPHGVLLTSITDKAGNKTTINLDAAADTISSVVDYLKRTWTFAYTGGNLTQITTPAPESLQYTLQYDPQGYDDLTNIELPSTAEGMHGYRFGYLDWQGNHSPYPMSLQAPGGLTTFDFFQDGALVNVFYLPLSQTTAMFHAEYNASARSNLVTFENPTANTPKSRLLFNGTYDQTGAPTQEFWVTSVTDDAGITSTVTRNARHEVTMLMDGFKQVWKYDYYPNAEDVKTQTDPTGKTTSLVWDAPGPVDGASSGQIASITDDATGLQKTFVWNHSASGFWYHTVDQIADAKVKLTFEKMPDLAGGAHAMRELVNGQLVHEVVIGARGDAVIEDDRLGSTERIGLDAFDQPSSIGLFSQGASVGQATVSLSPNGVLQSLGDVLGRSTKVGARDALLRVTRTALVLPGGEQDGTFGYAPDTSAPDGNAVTGSLSAHGVKRGWLRQKAAADGVDDCSDAVTVNGQTVSLGQTKVVVAGARVGCGTAPTPPTPPGDGGFSDAGLSSDAGWAVDAPPDVSLPEAGCAPPNGIACQVSALEQDGWCAYACTYEPAWLCQDPMNCSGTGLEEWNCPNPIPDPCPGF